MKPRLSTKKSAKQSFALTERDVERLLKEPSADSRLGVLEKIVQSYDRGEFNPREVAVAEQVFRLLVRDTELQVRQTLAESVKNNPYIPRDIVLSLAKDVEQVAIPVIEYSEVLSDADLVDIITTSRHMGKPTAVARRKKLSARVSNALVDTGSAQVVDALVRNAQADISTDAYGKIVKQFANEAEMMQRVARRPELPVTVVEKLITLVSSSLADQLEKKYQLTRTELAYEAEQARESTTLKLVQSSPGAAASDEEVEKLVEQLFAYNRLTPSMIFSALCRGNVPFFEISLAKLAHIPLKNARILLNDRGELGFKALYEKSELPESLFPAVRHVLRASRPLLAEGLTPGTPAFSNRLVEYLLAVAEEEAIDNLSYVLALVRQAEPS